MNRFAYFTVVTLAMLSTHLRANEKELGWLAEFTSHAGGSDTRIDRLVALYVPAAKSPTALLPPGAFTATYTGTVTLEFKGEYTFSAIGTGKLEVTVNGTTAITGVGDLSKATTKPVGLKKGDNLIVATYTSPEKGDAFFRLEWACDEFRHEPLDPRQITHSFDSKSLKQYQQLRLGRRLLAERHCLKCHITDAAWVKDAMPELQSEAPSLADIGARLQTPWIARWLHDPHALRPAATMPRVFAELDRGDDAKLDDRIRDMAAYLGSLGKADEKAIAVNKEFIEAGTRLFADLGCVGCHLAPDREDWRDDDHKRHPLRDVVSKYRPAALIDFLRQPDRHYLWVRMPNFALSQDEAMKLAAYLSSVKPREVFAEVKNADIARGKKLVDLSCLGCHRIGEKLIPPKEAPSFGKLTGDGLLRGCLSDKVGKSPAWDFDDDSKAALRTALADTKHLKHDSADEFARRQRDALRCAACHKLDTTEDKLAQLKEEIAGLTAELPPLDQEKESMFPAEQVRPPLTWIGEKLRPEWTTKLFAGKLDHKPRNYLKSRMPSFPRRAEMLAVGLAAEHGYAGTSPKPVMPDAKLAETARMLSGKGKWGCVGCHMVGTNAAVGVFEAPGPNFADIKDRMRREYFDRWMWAPTRVEPGTKMPVVYNWGKKSLLDDVLGGDSNKQIDALWAYFQTGRKIKAPEQ